MTAKEDRRSAANPTKQRLLPDLSAADYESLKESIRRCGVQVPAIVDQQGNTIDGWHRERACHELGIYCRREVRLFSSDVERIEVALRLNCNRRHLTRHQRREVIAAYLKCDPGINDSHLGEIVGTSKNTVAAVRGELEATCQIDKLPMRQGRDGKERPATYRRIITNTPRELENTLATIKVLPPSTTDKIMDTTIACRNLGQRFIGCDIDEQCVKLGIERLSISDPQVEGVIQ